MGQAGLVFLLVSMLAGCKGSAVNPEAAAYTDCQSPPQWALSVMGKTNKKTLSKITPFICKHGGEICYLFVQDFGAGENDPYRANLAVSCK